MKSLLKRTILASAIAGVCMGSAPATAHLVTFGWTDNGNGTVTLWGEQWHSDLTTAISDNGGIHITDTAGILAPFTAQWSGVLNNSDRDAMMASGILTGYFVDPGNAGSGTYDDWVYTSPLVIGNGTWNFFTGTNCCYDTMSGPVQVTLSGITSVDPGTGPSAPTVPLPGAAWLFASGILGMIGFARKKAA